MPFPPDSVLEEGVNPREVFHVSSLQDAGSGFTKQFHLSGQWKASLGFLDGLGYAAAWKSLDREGCWTIECNDLARAALPDEADGDASRLAAWLEDQPADFFELSTGELWLWRSGKSEKHPGEPLTTREDEVATLLLAGKTAEEVAIILSLSPRTVEKHIQHIYAKTGARSRMEFFRIALTNHDGAAQPAE